jgi:peptidoglycan/LPS O-acetylase OafA/YrhL
MHLQPEEKYSETERKAGRKYLRELFGSIAIYAALLMPSVTYGPTMDSGLFKTAVLVCPMIGFFLMIWAVARQVGRMDEYQRGVMLETFAIAAAVTAGVTFTYGFLENAGYPRLSMFTVWGVMGGSWFVVGVLRRRMMER